MNVDRYGDFVVVQWLSGGRLALAGRAVRRHRGGHPAARASTSSGACGRWAARPPPEPAVRARGEEAPLEVVVEEAGCRFAVDVTAPLGVGFYPDLRRGRDAVAARAADRRVLNLFSYTGAFSIRAAHAGAQRGGLGRQRGQGARPRPPQRRAVAAWPGPHRGDDDGRHQGARALRRPRPAVRHRGLRPADVLARPGRGRAVLGHPGSRRRWPPPA